MNFFKCEISIRFTDREVVEWLVYNGELDEEEAKTYIPTYDDRKNYAWYCVENEYCEYGDCEEVK